jgi:hypothetical protein
MRRWVEALLESSTGRQDFVAYLDERRRQVLERVSEVVVDSEDLTDLFRARGELVLIRDLRACVESENRERMVNDAFQKERRR